MYLHLFISYGHASSSPDKTLSSITTPERFKLILKALKMIQLCLNNILPSPLTLGLEGQWLLFHTDDPSRRPGAKDQDLCRSKGIQPH